MVLAQQPRPKLGGLSGTLHPCPTSPSAQVRSLTLRVPVSLGGHWRPDEQEALGHHRREAARGPVTP